MKVYRRLEFDMAFKPLVIGNLIARFPIIQGGMGVGISRGNLAGAVAKEGGIGVISTAQIGYDEPEFESSPLKANLNAIKKHISRGKEISHGGIIGANIMVATRNYSEYVKAAVSAGVDMIISGAGLPVSLPELVSGTKTKIAPIVSSLKAAAVILKLWDKKYKRTADCIVIEGPLAGGHLGFSPEELSDINALNYDEEIKSIISFKKQYEIKYNQSIPVVVAGGIFDHSDISHAISLGADGVQIASRFVVTEECDASLAYKQAYIDAKKEDIKITISPVGMPGRAIMNKFLSHIKDAKEPITRCYQCLERCNPADTPYCITKALINAVKGDIENGLIFCGDNIDRLHEMTTVHDLMLELMKAEESEKIYYMPASAVI